MANVEGAKRMMRAGKFIVIGGLASAALGAAIACVGATLIHGSAGNFFPVVPLLVIFSIYPVALGAVLWIAGWVAEGFIARAGD